MADKMCVYYQGGDDFADSSIIRAGLPIVVANFTIAGCQADGYIIAHRNLETVLDLLRNLFDFVPHNRVLMICSSYKCSDLQPWILRSKLHALDVLTLDIIKSPNIWDLESNFEVRITSITTGAEISDVQQLGFKKWVPYFGNDTVKVVTFEYRPFSFMDSDGNFVGFENVILGQLMEDWPYEIVLFPKHSWINVSEAVETYTVNVSASGHWWMGLSYMNVDIAYPHSQVQSVILVPKPHVLPMQTFVFHAMTLNMWLIVLITIIVFAVSNYLIAKLHYRKSQNVNFCEILLAAFGLLLANSNQLHTKLYILKLLSLLWTLTSLLLNTAYSAGFSSVNTLPRYSKPINNFDDLAASRLQCYEITNVSGISLSSSLNQGKKEIASRTNAYHRGDIPIDACSFGEVLGNEYVTSEHTFAGRAKTHTKIIKKPYQSSYLAIALNKNSPYTRIFDEKIKLFWEYGFFQHWLVRSTIRDFKTLQDMHYFYTDSTTTLGTAKALNMSKLQGVFYAWLFGLVASVSAFIFEVYDPCKTSLKEETTN